MLRIGRRALYAYAEGEKVVYVGPTPLPDREPSRRLEEELREYLKGSRRSFSFYPDLSVYTPAVRRVLEYVYLNLSYGRTATYSEIAEAVGTHPRVVGLAMAKNRHLIVIPCHRVVGKRGLGGFSLGLEVKRLLLSVEAAETATKLDL